ncbi:hypothetical protein LCGC14_1287480 [marine sediment metagenome]|uniref:Uncharacterized protein n=1 Tax=marine sediment metagenome TaxID=412755 RepID=A0A0F9KV57_9ZZZZ
MPKQNPKEARDVQKRLESRLVKPKQKRPSLRKYMPVGVIIGAFVIVASLIFTKMRLLPLSLLMEILALH